MTTCSYSHPPFLAVTTLFQKLWNLQWNFYMRCLWATPSNWCIYTATKCCMQTTCRSHNEKKLMYQTTAYSHTWPSFSWAPQCTTTKLHVSTCNSTSTQRQWKTYLITSLLKRFLQIPIFEKCHWLFYIFTKLQITIVCRTAEMNCSM